MSSGSPGPHKGALEPTATVTVGNVKVQFYPQTTVVQTTAADGRIINTAVDTTTGRTVADGAPGN